MQKILIKLLFWAALLPTAALAQAGLPVYDFMIVHAYPHDPAAFTQGLLYRDGFLYESTGLNGRSSIRKVEIETGKVLRKKDLAEDIFGEGLTAWKDELVGITWKSHVAFVFDLATFKLRRQHSYPGEGWGITHNGHQLIMSDGTSALRVIDPQSFRELRRIQVTANGKPLDQINELEWVGEEIFANLWQTNYIARIDPASGKVVGVIDLTGLLQSQGSTAGADVLNGIAYDADKKRLFVTGKLWPKLFEIALVPRLAK
ncbi:MAG: glutaminyl-peptide cyclotransferase [Pseudomonadota bacterium]